MESAYLFYLLSINQCLQSRIVCTFFTYCSDTYYAYLYLLPVFSCKLFIPVIFSICNTTNLTRPDSYMFHHSHVFIYTAGLVLKWLSSITSGLMFHSNRLYGLTLWIPSHMVWMATESTSRTLKNIFLLYREQNWKLNCLNSV